VRGSAPQRYISAIGLADSATQPRIATPYAYADEGELETIRLALSRDPLAVPMIGAPLAGGPTTPALAAAVCERGGPGFLAAGYKTATALGEDINALRRLTQRPFAVNIVYPVREQINDARRCVR
jgi:Nitronate monooxygenase